MFCSFSLMIVKNGIPFIVINVVGLLSSIKYSPTLLLLEFDIHVLFVLRTVYQ